MMPCSSITIIASGIVSRIERKCLSRVLTVVLETFLLVDVDHDAAEPGRSAIGAVDGGADRAHPVTLVRPPPNPELSIEIAPGIDRLLHRRSPCDRDPAVRAGKETGRSRQAHPARRRRAFGWRWTSSTSGSTIRDPRRRRPIPRHRCARSGRADPDLETGGRGRSCFALQAFLIFRYRIRSHV